MPTNHENPPIDAIAEQAGAIVRAAITWRENRRDHDKLTAAEWLLLEAVDNYGREYRGLRAQ